MDRQRPKKDNSFSLLNPQPTIIFSVLLGIIFSLTFPVNSTVLAAGDKKKERSTAKRAKEELVDRIIAVVNGNPILYSDIQEKVNIGPAVLISPYPAKDNASDYERAVYDAINLQLIKEHAEELEIEVSDSQIDGHIDSILSQQNLDKQRFVEILNGEGKTLAEYREDVRLQFLIRRFQGRVLVPQMKITDKDIETYYMLKSGSDNKNVEITLRQILIYASDSNSQVLADKRKLINDIHGKLQSGLDFVEAVKLYSDEPDADASGGLMKNLSMSSLNEAIRPAIEPLAEGEFSSPVKTSIGFHIFYLVEKAFALDADYKAQKDRIEGELRILEMGKVMKRWLQVQHEKSKIEILLD